MIMAATNKPGRKGYSQAKIAKAGLPALAEVLGSLQLEVGDRVSVSQGGIWVGRITSISPEHTRAQKVLLKCERTGRIIETNVGACSYSPSLDEIWGERTKAIQTTWTENQELDARVGTNKRMAVETKVSIVDGIGPSQSNGPQNKRY